MKTLTIENVPGEIADALEREANRRGASVTGTAVELLGQALGVGERRSNGLAHLAGVWSEEEYQEFEAATSAFEEIDEEMWE